MIDFKIFLVFDDATVWRFDYRNYGRKKERISEKVEMNGFSKKENVPESTPNGNIPNSVPDPVPEVKTEPKKEPVEDTPVSNINIATEPEPDEPKGKTNGPEIGPVPMDTLEPMEVVESCPDEETPLKPVESDL